MCEDLLLGCLMYYIGLYVCLYASTTLLWFCNFVIIFDIKKYEPSDLFFLRSEKVFLRFFFLAVLCLRCSAWAFSSCPVFPTPFIEETLFPPLCILASFVVALSLIFAILSMVCLVCDLSVDPVWAVCASCT